MGKSKVSRDLREGARRNREAARLHDQYWTLQEIGDYQGRSKQAVSEGLARLKERMLDEGAELVERRMLRELAVFDTREELWLRLYTTALHLMKNIDAEIEAGVADQNKTLAFAQNTLSVMSEADKALDRVQTRRIRMCGLNAPEKAELEIKDPHKAHAVLRKFLEEKNWPEEKIRELIGEQS